MSFSEDPYDIVKVEVCKALTKTRCLFTQWQHFNETSKQIETDEIEWVSTELRNSLRSIEWDLEDLEDTVCIVEKNPQKFKIDKIELIGRRKFIDLTRNEVKLMKEYTVLKKNYDSDLKLNQEKTFLPLNSPNNKRNSGISINIINSSVNNMANRHSGTKYSKLENQPESPAHNASGNGQFLDEQVSVQSHMFNQQDEQLDMINHSVGQLKTVSQQIRIELDDQSVMIDDLSNVLDHTESRLETTVKRITKVMHLNKEKNQWTAIFILLVALLVVITLVFFV